MDTLENLRKFDLNKLIVFMAVYRLRSVSKAAAVLGLTQPAVSNTLSSLRLTLGDELFVRGHSMMPTRKGVMLAEVLAPTLHAIDSVLGAVMNPAVNPASSSGEFQ